MLTTWGPATAATFTRYDGEPDPEILAAAQRQDVAIMADPLARARHEMDFWTGRLESELGEIETIDDYRRAEDRPVAPLAPEQRDRFRRALRLVETGTAIPEAYLARHRADCLDMAGHGAAGLHRASVALQMALAGGPRPPAVVVPYPAASPAPAAARESSQAA